jgi:hypothetical protein
MCEVWFLILRRECKLRAFENKMRWAGRSGCTGEMKSAHKILVGKHEGKKHLSHIGVEGTVIR